MLPRFKNSSVRREKIHKVSPQQLRITDVVIFTDWVIKKSGFTRLFGQKLNPHPLLTPKIDGFTSFSSKHVIFVPIATLPFPSINYVSLRLKNFLQILNSYFVLILKVCFYPPLLFL